jgi:signal transduction histidine kinase
METVEERRELVLTLCRSVKRSARLAIGHSNTLLDETGDSLNDEQTADLTRIRAAAAKMLDLVRMATEEVTAHEHQTTEQVDFERFLHVVLHDLRAQISLIIGFSRVLADEMLGPLSAEQEDVLRQIEALGRMLASSVTECQETVWPTGAESGIDPPTQ